MVNRKSLITELQLALDRALSAGLGAFVGTLAYSPSHDLKSLSIAGMAAGGIALASLSNSLRALSGQDAGSSSINPVINVNSSLDPAVIAEEVSKALKSAILPVAAEPAPNPSAVGGPVIHQES